MRLSVLLLLAWNWIAQLPAATSISAPYRGVTHIERTESQPRPVSMHIVKIDLRASGIRFKLTAPSGTREVVRQTTLEFLRQEKAQIAINAHFFVPYPSQDKEVWLVGLAASNGNVYSTFERPVQSYAIVANAPALNIDAENRASIVRAGSPEAGLWNAVSGSAQIITNGKPTVPEYVDAEHPDALLTPGGPGRYSVSNSWYNVPNARTVIGLSADRRTLFLFTVDRSGESRGMTLPEVADLLIKDYGVHDALNLDGGGSTTLAIKDAIVNRSSDNTNGRAVGSSLAVFAQEALPFWGQLEPGPHAAGFRWSYRFDTARKGRPVLAAMWYPAIKNSGAPMRYEHYHSPPPAADFPDFAPRLKEFSLHSMQETVFGKKPSGDFVDTQRRLLASVVAARREATPAEGRFPVVLYHSGAGGTLEDNWVMFEYLASHGFVVMSSPYPSEHATYLGNNRDGPRTSLRDLAVLARYVRSLPFADAGRIAGIGHSMGSWYMLQWAGRKNTPLRAVVSLDSTLEYTGENFKGHQSVRRALKKSRKPRIPVMLFATEERQPRFGTYDAYLKNAPHQGATIPRLTHDDYLTQGAIRREIHPRDERDRADAADIRAAYELLCSRVLAFLKSSF